MIKVYNPKELDIRLPIKSWCSDLEDEALYQAKVIADLPFTFKHISLMADSHVGYSMPIGCVVATDRVVIPSFVGSDIGCGVSLKNTNIELKDIDNSIMIRIINTLQKEIPNGRDFVSNKSIYFKYNMRIVEELIDKHFKVDRDWMLDKILGLNDYSSIQKFIAESIGSIGGGNHFLELQESQDRNLSLMVHSGSRKLGGKIAKYFTKLAEEKNSKWFSSIPKECSFLPIDDQGKLYIKYMNFALDIAYTNRKLILDRSLEMICEILKIDVDDIVTNDINCHHNFCQYENHFGKNVIVHRKGAIQMREGDIGLIPSSMGTPSYIVKGKGESVSFNSSSHGAGRVMSRSQAFKKLDVKDEMNKLKNVIVFNKSINDILDESVGAYKDIDVVMENQKDLLDIVSVLKPIGTIKGRD